jgi:hypothetical protein
MRQAMDKRMLPEKLRLKMYLVQMIFNGEDGHFSAARY